MNTRHTEPVHVLQRTKGLLEVRFWRRVRAALGRLPEQLERASVRDPLRPFDDTRAQLTIIGQHTKVDGKLYEAFELGANE